MAIKRKATDPVRPDPSPSKKQHVEVKRELSNGEIKFDHSRIEEKVGIVQREFYPPEMSNERAKQYHEGEIPRPIQVLHAMLAQTKAGRENIAVGECLVHWFKRDLRLFDNKALHLASEKAKGKNVPLVCMFVISPQDYQAHLTSPARVDFELRTLDIMKKDLAELDIPLYVTTIEDRKDVMPHILGKCTEWGAKHLFCNIEYEVDELRRETKLVKDGLAQGIALEAVHDDVVVAPGELKTGAGKQYSVYSPWFRSWIKHIHEHPHLLNAFDPPTQNPPSAREKFRAIFDMSTPSAPSNKSLTPEEKDCLTQLWPAGEHEARERLDRFLSEKIGKYKDTRNFPALQSTASLSVHFSSGTLAARTAVRSARDANSANKLDAGNTGITCWISEIAWRDFYKHVLAHWPYVCMHKPFKYEYSDIEWEYDEDQFKLWCEGRTGFPIVDAAMRQMRSMAYMHNRCRMITASFLAKDLLIDWRMGERYFMEHLIDGDFASNNGGWGFSASTGVDPQPYFRIFNPLLQSEKFDMEGEYIRKWVPELRGIEGKAIHAPYERGKAKEAEKAGYPRPMVDHKQAREKALARYKGGLGRSTANVGGGVHN
ncbi:Deoxyribodipyrimidine photo-lyase [Fulvia fulva]|uniref:Deoxyribodipyrimidine photo-lyase n=1 Tax=Passalora fulva TaxID=5499 RepID=A0A9Q8LFE0_PASFU|nr:Deoxyribodipyrimidine photo-lyase [Fulvia fulva]KAK4626357.1 Deoxyribodipyrimidine photo-lyase [Fulvia fulva]KAK4628058.1 Deoxyribodipyrimidine photo-lyase [Fulvia fulva]UJO16390.1 Deoxyribodipyrimidine photo-lyase [Fulvia fulva]WPV14062.1 Deoxyribodipyrimidine photo-lyase [Fulvia fulva]WPV28844.1 Deoxyribodipyrimidine photo-lyase [Fulvia fulva]